MSTLSGHRRMIGKGLKRGLIQIYTGEGKGKSTAAIGQAVRAVSHGFKVGFISFFKDPDRFGYGEIEPLKKIGVAVFHFARKHPHFYKKLSYDEVRKECLNGIGFVRELFNDASWDMLILDEINIALRDGFLTEGEILSLLEEKPANLNLILTGRGATEAIIKKADLVSEIRKIKHHYDQRIPEQKGIEY